MRNPLSSIRFPFLSSSLRGAKRRSNPALFWLDGLLRFAMTNLSMLMLLLLLLLLAHFDNSTMRKGNRLAQHVEIADVVRQDQDQRGIEIGALRIADAAMCFDDQPIGGVWIGEVRLR